VRVKEFKEKSEKVKSMMGMEQYETLAEDLRKDEKKLAVSNTSYSGTRLVIQNSLLLFTISYHLCFSEHY
jgi:hypothetical protein